MPPNLLNISAVPKILEMLKTYFEGGGGKIASTYNSSVKNLIDPLVEQDFEVSIHIVHVGIEEKQGGGVSALSAGAFTTDLLVDCIDRVKGEGRGSPQLHQAGLILPSGLNVRQKVAIATLCRTDIYSEKKVGEIANKTSILYNVFLQMSYLINRNTYSRPMPEIIDPVFAKTSPKRSF